MSLRLYVDLPLSASLELDLPEDAARHVQVRRLQPGDALRLFDGRGGEWAATVVRMGKRDVAVQVLAHHAIDREWPFELHIALGMPTNERMDDLVEKATELGATSIQPLQTERSVLRLEGERAAKRIAHWQAVAAGAAEQSGRSRVPAVRPVQALMRWLAGPAATDGFLGRFLMSPGDAPVLAAHLPATAPAGSRWLALSGPEGGLTPDEEAGALRLGYLPASLGPQVLRADTAPLAWLSQMAALLRR